MPRKISWRRSQAAICRSSGTSAVRSSSSKTGTSKLENRLTRARPATFLTQACGCWIDVQFCQASSIANGVTSVASVSVAPCANRNATIFGVYCR